MNNHNRGNNHNKIKRKKKKSFVDIKIKILVAILLVFLAVGLTAAGVAYAVIKAYIEDLPELDSNLLIPSQTTALYDRYEKHWTDVYSDQNRIQVTLSQIPQHVQDAFIAIEDERFYEHSGIDLKAIGRAFVSNLRRQRITQGGSTIAQQLVKNVFLTPDRDYKRKVQEAYLAFQLERVFHKEEILEYYLNWIYFDYSTNGVEAASQMLFRKSVGDLTVAEAAMLAGVPNNPSLFSPYRSEEGSRNRQLIILGKMLELEMITQEEYQEAKDEEITIYPPPSRTAPHFHFYEYLIHHELRKLLPTIPELAEIPWHIAMYKGGLHIYTTLDPDLQDFVDEVVNDPKNYPTTVEKRGIINPQANVVLAEPETGYIRVLQGGRDAGKDNQILRFNVGRDTGSAIKPIITYAPALEAGVITAATPIDDAPIEIRDYRPENFYKIFYGLVNMREAIAMSYNVSAVQVFNELGPSKGIEYAQRLGLESLIDPPGITTAGGERKHDHNISATLGGLTRGVTTLEMVQSFATLANGGLRLDLTTVTRIEDSDGKVLYEHKPEPKRVVSEETAYIMTDMLIETVRAGTGTYLKLNHPLAAKTGTSSERRTGYLVAYTRDYVMGYWMGYDYPTDGEIRSPWTQAPKFFNPILRKAHEGLPVRNFNRPSTIINASVCVKSGLQPGPRCPKKHIVSELFVQGTEPEEECDLHATMLLCSVSGRLPDKFCPKHLLKRRVVFDRPEYLTTTEDWTYGAGRTPPDINNMPPTEPCNVHTDRPQAPQNLSYTISNGIVTLQWNKPGGMAIKGYLVYRQVKGEAVFKQLTVGPINKTSFADDNIQEEKTYTFKVISVSTRETLSPEASITVEVPKEQIFTLTMQKEGEGTVEPAAGSHSYPKGTKVQLKANPADGWVFVEWQGEGIKDRTKANTDVDMDKDKTVKAVFARIQHTLTVTDKQGGNQHCTTNPAPGTYTYNEGTEVILSASVAPPASDNYEFEKWVVNNTTYTNATIKLIMNENKTAVAHFKEKQSNSTTLDWLSIFRRYLAMF